MFRWLSRRRLARQIAKENHERQIQALLKARAQIVVRYRPDGGLSTLGKYILDIEPWGHPDGFGFESAGSRARRWAQRFHDCGVWINDDRELIPARFITSIRVHER